MVKKVFNPPTVALVAVLLLALAGLEATTAAKGVHLIKRAAPLRQRLFLLPGDVGPYHKVSEDRLPHEAAEELGTDQFISWVYEDTRVKPGESGREVRVLIAYHTGDPQTLPHVPPGCYSAGPNAVAVDTAPRRITLSSPHIYTAPNAPISATLESGKDLRLPTVDVPITLYHYKPAAAAPPAAMVYLFLCNGQPVASGDDAAARFADLRARRSYWCKIELQPRVDGGDEQTVEAAQRFLSRLLPEIQACMPEPE